MSVTSLMTCHWIWTMPMMLHSEATNFPPVFCATKPPVVGKDGRHVSFAASTFPLTGHTRTDAKPWSSSFWRSWRATLWTNTTVKHDMRRCCAIRQKLKSRHVSKSRAQALRMAPSPSAKQTVTLLWKDFMPRILLWRHPAMAFDKSQGNKLPTTCRGCTFLSLLHRNQNPWKSNLYPKWWVVVVLS